MPIGVLSSYFLAVFSEKLIILCCFVWMLHVFSEKYVIFAEEKAALGNLKTSFHCARLHYLCRKLDT